MNTDALSEKLQELEVKVTGLSALAETKKPWYLEGSTIVAALALLFSFGTTLVSYKKAIEQEYIASRVELRSVMERLSELTLRHSEMLLEQKDNPAVTAQLSAQMNAENLSLSNQADAIISRIENSSAGKDKILDVEFLTVAAALSSSFQHKKAETLMEEALKRSRDATTEAGALRSLAGISLYFNEVDKARAYMLEARNIYDKNKYSGDATINKDVTNATTEIQWANMEFFVGNCTEARAHHAEGIGLLRAIPDSQVKSQLSAQYLDLENRLKACR